LARFVREVGFRKTQLKEAEEEAALKALKKK
jgi:hypothetical protein